MKLSYKTPSTMYTVTSAARIKIGSFCSEAWNEAAVPWKAACTLSGMPISRCASSIARVASPSDALGARLNEIVTTGNCPWWFTESAADRVSKCVNVLSGTALPFTAVTAAGFAEPELVCALGFELGLGLELPVFDEEVMIEFAEFDVVLSVEFPSADLT